MLLDKKSKLENLFFFIILFIALFTIPSIYNLNYGLNYFDQGSFINKIRRIEEGFFIESIKGHFQPILIIVSFLSKNISIEFKSYFLLLLQSLFLSIPIIYFDKKIKILYALSFVIWSAAFIGFHTDVFCLIFLYYYFTSKKNLKIFSLIVLLTIKEIFILCFLFHSFNYLFKKNYKEFSKVFIISLTFLLIYIFSKNIIITHILIEDIGFENSIKFDFFNNTLIYKLIFFLFLYSLFNFKFNNIKNYIFFFSPILFFNLFTNNVNYLMPFHHYFLVYLIPIFISLQNNIINLNKNFKNYFIFYLLLNFLITYSPISLRFIFLKDNPYNFRSYLSKSVYTNHQNNLETILDSIGKDDLILVENNAYIPELNRSNFVIAYQENYLNYYDEILYKSKLKGIRYNFHKPDLIVLSNKKIAFEDDKICVNCRQDRIKKIKDNGFQKIFSNHKIQIFK